MSRYLPLAIAAGLITGPAVAQQGQFAAPIPGLCTLAREAAINSSRAGQAADVRLRQLIAGVQAELGPQQQAILQENNALNAPQSAIPAPQRAQRQAALQQRATSFTQLQQLRQSQIQLTKNQATQKLVTAIDPLLGSLVQTRRCAIVLERGATYGANPAMDLTPALVAQLDQQMPTMTFNLVPPESIR